ncbi:TPA: hypothetical protein ACPWIG_005189 [Pseudomonas aeruginosa]|uniref:hypothetical protein n=1 Tax=Pseudomonas aeruginosa TaxID=287 RepID=UPI000E32FB65|nr:hypothetical protein [Pseudomonas aeruginosa]MDP2556134.1 hypothetical protein [Pseudomonas aeruginosa]QPN18000.1 hypothetical protein I5U70_32830 [Pseudomonas aeruginosa]SYY08059.1 Uncharacterised protein [Acinetobacter baumannii]HBN8448280.1 hypothetical protein [Pseudomonas aeruginosa]
MKTIDLTPTWGEIGLMYARLAESGEVAAIREMRSEIARAFAAAQALQAIQSSLPDDLNEAACKVVTEELAKQGF